MLSPEEKAELEALRREQGPMNQGSLSPAEKAELEQLRAEQDGPKQEGAADKSFGRALGENVPFGPTMQRVMDKGRPYDKGVEGVSQGLGDVGAGAGLAAAGMALGAAPVALGLGAGALAGAGLEKAGVSPWLRDKAQGIRQGAEPVEPFVSPSSSIPDFLRPEMVQAMLKQIPRELGATSVDLIPSLLSSLAGAAGLGAAKVGAAKIGNLKTQAPGAAGALQAAGGEVTPAMVRAAQGKQGGIASGVESVTRANPLTSGMMQKIDKKNVGAIQKVMRDEIPSSEMTPQAAGEAFGQNMEAFQKRRGGEVGAAKAKASTLDAGDVGTIASKKIIAKLEEGKVPFDGKGFDTESMKGLGKMGKAQAEALVKAERDLKGASVEQAINYLDHFDENFGADLSAKYPKQASLAIRDARALIKDSIIEAVASKDKKLASEYRRADRQYSVSQPTATKVLEKFRGETPMSEIIKSTMGKAGAKADKGLRRLRGTMNDQEFSKVQDSLVSEVLKSSKGNKGISLQKLETNIREMGENVKFLKPEHLATLKKVQEMMKAANVVDLEMPNASGTGSRLFQNLATTGGAAAVGTALSSPAPLLGYLGGSAASAAYMKLPMVQAALAKLMKPMGAKASGAMSKIKFKDVVAENTLGNFHAPQAAQ